MLTRIVKLTFSHEHIEQFKAHFEAHKTQIRNFDGCTFLEVYQDLHNTSIFFTYSYWKSEAHLNAYRDSELFKGVWKTTKQWFAEKPEAWSVHKLVTLP